MSRKVLVTKSSMPPIEEFYEEIKSIWDSHWLTNMGEKHNELQKELIKYLGVKDIELFTNGHLSLEIGLQAMNLKKGGEVITTPFTFASTTHAIVRSGLKPVFCDIREDDYTIDASLIEEKITENTVAIVPVHVYGNVCDVEEIERIAKRHNLKVFYDAAHAFGEVYKGTGIGNFGDASMFSFHATKVFNTIEGGAVCHKDEAFGDRMKKIKNFGICDETTVENVGTNAKMNEFQATMGICNLRHLDEEITKRKKVVERYRDGLKDIPGLKLNVQQKDVKSNYAYFPIVIEAETFGATRDEVYDRLKKEDILARKYFYPLTNCFECYKNQFDVKDTPVALKISERVLTLPLYADLEMETVDKICNIIKNIKE